MSAAEIIYRLKGKALSTVQRLGAASGTRVPPADPDAFPDYQWLRQIPDVEASTYIQAAEQVLAGRISVFALEDAGLGATPRWNRDPLTGREAPLTFGKSLDYRDEALVGNIKYLWEPNRHLQLVTLAQAYGLTRDDRYLQGIRRQLTSWFEQCPYPLGPNWSSSLELGIRLINWSITWRLIGGAESSLFTGEGDGFRNQWLTAIYQHQHFIAGHFSRYSSANNHLIGEAAGLFVASCTWPLWEHSRDWQKRSRAILVEQALLQNTADGVNREQAISYQQFVLDFLLLPALAGRDAGIEFPAEYWQRIEAMLEFLASIMDVRGHVPMIGDADDGYVVLMARQDCFCPYRSLLASGAVLFKRADFRRKAGSLDDKTRWLLGDDAAGFDALPDAPADRFPVRRAFPEGGYWILGDRFETEEEIRMVADCGPLGYLSIAAHGHADALSFILSAGGREFLIDPGTYAYHTLRLWRDYFRGTAAHNTVRVDSTDQSEIGGNFMWVRHARARCELWKSTPDLDHFVGSHDGYHVLPDPVTHRRGIKYHKPDRKFRITDTLECRQRHQVERFWHFSEECQVRLDGNVIVAVNDGIRIHIVPDGNVEAKLYSGDEDRPAGWVSRRFDVKQPTATVVWASHIDGTTSLAAEISCFV